MPRGIDIGVHRSDFLGAFRVKLNRQGSPQPAAGAPWLMAALLGSSSTR